MSKKSRSRRMSFDCTLDSCQFDSCHCTYPSVSRAASKHCAVALKMAPIATKEACSHRQGLSSRFFSLLRWLSFFFMSSSICSKDMSSVRRAGNAACPWNALSVYLASKPSVEEDIY